MTPEQFRKAEELFHAARELAPGKRRAFLDAACGDDAEFQAEVERLLALAPTALMEVGTSTQTVPRRAAGPAVDSRPTIIPNYRILSEIGRGGQGVVFKAVQESTKREVAVKVLLAGTLASEAERRRFEREMDLIAAMQHPNIVTVFDGGTTPQGHQWYAMEYLEGVRLDDYVRSRRHLGPEGGREATKKLIELFTKICSAVSYAHQRGVIHRDLKPSNIRIDPKDEPHILDFGIAKALGQQENEARLTLSGAFIGTLAYASPEQAAGDPRKVDTRSDVYSLGVILYEMFTGQYPYSVAGTMAEVLRNIAEAPPERPSSWHKKGRPHEKEDRYRSASHRVDGELETIILKALAKEPDRRYLTAEHLRRDLENYLTGRPIEARPDSALYVLRKLAGRNAYAAAVLALLFVSLCAFAFISFQFYLDARQALADQEASDAIALQKDQDNDVLSHDAAAALHRIAFEKFLVEWRDGKLDRAAAYTKHVPPDSPERAAMLFLLSEAEAPQTVIPDAGFVGAAWVYYAHGEQHRQGGRPVDARAAYEACLAAAAPQSWLAGVAIQALDELRSASGGTEEVSRP